MNINVLTTTFIAAAMLFAAGCDKDNSKSDWPGDQQKPRISRIYAGNYIIKEEKNGGQWTTVEKQTDPLALVNEFNWSGDTLKSFKHNNLLYVFEHDDAGRIISASATGSAEYTFFYNSDGNLVRTRCTANNEDGSETDKVIDYNWSQGHISKIVYELYVTSEGNSSFSRFIFKYNWSGENKFSTCSITYSDDSTTKSYDYRYSFKEYLNPLCDFILCLDPDFGMPYSDQCINALSPYMPSMINGASGKVEFDYPRHKADVYNFKTIHKEVSDDGTKRTTTGVNYKMEFVKQ